MLIEVSRLKLRPVSKFAAHAYAAKDLHGPRPMSFAATHNAGG
jgi:hypothetical protein